MNRKVIFRAKDAKTGNWQCGDLHNATYDGKDVPVIITNRDLVFDEEVDKLENVALVFGCEEVAVCDPATIGQYTGLKDSKGTPIYEGDVVRNGEQGFLYVVVWHDCGLCGKQIGSSSYIGLTVWRDRLIIVGNRYDNPELLEVKKPEPPKNGLLPHEFRIRALYDNGCMSVKGHIYIAERVKLRHKDVIRVWAESSKLDDEGKRRYGTYCNMNLSILGNDRVCANYEIVEENKKNESRIRNNV